MPSCHSCGVEIPSGQPICSMCYGDPFYGSDGYYLQWLEHSNYIQDCERQRQEHEAEQQQQDDPGVPDGNPLPGVPDGNPGGENADIQAG